MATKHLIIKGKVQGVFYRATAKEVAEKLGITGWVKNTPDGNVEAVITGDEMQLQQFVSWCYQGPANAVVTTVEVQELPPQVFSGFFIKRDQF